MILVNEIRGASKKKEKTIDIKGKRKKKLKTIDIRGASKKKKKSDLDDTGQ